MSKLGAINNLNKIHAKIQKYKLLRREIKYKLKRVSSHEAKMQLSNDLSKIPHLASKVKMRKRCFVTGRARGYYNAFGISRIVLRQMASNGLIPGLTKSS